MNEPMRLQVLRKGTQHIAVYMEIGGHHNLMVNNVEFLKLSDGEARVSMDFAPSLTRPEGRNETIDTRDMTRDISRVQEVHWNDQQTIDRLGHWLGAFPGIRLELEMIVEGRRRFLFNATHPEGLYDRLSLAFIGETS